MHQWECVLDQSEKCTLSMDASSQVYEVERQTSLPMSIPDRILPDTQQDVAMVINIARSDT